MEKYKIKKICFELRAVHIKYPEVFPLTTHSVWTKNMMKLLRGKKGNTPFYSWLSKNWRNSRHILVSFDPILFSTRPYIFKRNLFFFFLVNEIAAQLWKVLEPFLETFEGIENVCPGEMMTKIISGFQDLRLSCEFVFTVASNARICFNSQKL